MRPPSFHHLISRYAKTHFPCLNFSRVMISIRRLKFDVYFCLSTSASSSSSCRRMQLTRCVVISSLNVFTLNQLADSLLRMSSALTHVSLRDHIFGNFSSRVIFSSDTVFSVNKILSYFCTDHYILSKPAVLNLLSLAYPK